MNELNLNNSNCTKCSKLSACRKQVVNGIGPLNTKIMIVGEAPGPDENDYGKPFIGRAGQYLTKLLAQAGINREEVFISNCVRCFPKNEDKNVMASFRAPTFEEIEACRPYLLQEIEAIKPNVIVPVGSAALSAILGSKSAAASTKITKVRGTEFWSDELNCKIMPTFHPSAVMRDPSKEPTVVQDFVRIKTSSEYKELTKGDEGTYVVLDTLEKVDAFFDRIKEVPEFVFDIETNSLNWREGLILEVAFSWKEKTACVLPLTKYIGIPYKEIEIKKRKVRKKGQVIETEKQIEVEKIKDTYELVWRDKQEYVLGKLKELMESDKPRIAHNSKFDNKWFMQLGWDVTPTTFDTMLAAHLLDENHKGSWGLKDLALNFTMMGEYDRPLETWFKERKVTDSNRNYAHVPEEIRHKYAAMDADATFRLKSLFQTKLNEENMLDLFFRLIMPLNHNLTIAEFEGVKIDLEYLSTLKKELEIEIGDLEKRIKAVTGEINLNSDDQLSNLLFKQLKLPKIKKTKKGADSTDKEVLEILSDVHPIPALILEYRKLEKLYNTYVVGIEEKLDKNGYLHGSFNIDGTESGRLSCVPLNSEILTKHGWKTYDQLKIGEEVMGFDIQTYNYQWTPLRAIHHGRGTVGLIKTTNGHGQKRGVLCTGNHKWIAEANKIIGFAEAQLFPRKTHLLLQPKSEMPDVLNSILNPTEAALFGWYLTDGFITGKKHFGLGINLMKARSREILEKLLINVPHTKSTYRRSCDLHHNIFAYHISSKIFDPIYRAATSVRPAEFILRLSKEARKAMFAAMLEADGSMRRGTKRYDRFGALASYKKNTKEYFEVLSLSLGQPFTFKENPELHTKTFNRRAFINYNLIANTPLWADKNHDWEPIEEMDVWCPQTGCGTWVMRQGHHVVVTGNSSGPNLQNIPKEDKRIKKMFVPEEESIMAEGDLSQAEIRFWADFSRDPQMLMDLSDPNFDMHRNTAVSAYKILAEQVTETQRRLAKRTAFGLLYGMGDEKFARQNKCSIDDAAKGRLAFFGRYPIAKQWLFHIVKEARMNGFVRNLFGRIRHLPGISSQDEMVKYEAEAAAKNSPIQGTASDYACNAANRILIRFKELGLHGKLKILVHDAIIMSLPKNEFEQSIQIMKEEMERPVCNMAVVMKADFAIGNNWAEMQKYKFKEAVKI